MSKKKETIREYIIRNIASFGSKEEFEKVLVSVLEELQTPPEDNKHQVAYFKKVLSAYKKYF